MIIHIIKSDEKLSDILNYYNITFEDLKLNNLHITDFKNLRAGTKIKIPNISSNIEQVLNNTEPLVSSYFEQEINNENIPSDEDENKLVNKLEAQNNNFRGVNFIRPKKIFELPSLKKSIYPYFRKNNKEDKK